MLGPIQDSFHTHTHTAHTHTHTNCRGHTDKTYTHTLGGRDTALTCRHKHTHTISFLAEHCVTENSPTRPGGTTDGSTGPIQEDNTSTVANQKTVTSRLNLLSVLYITCLQSVIGASFCWFLVSQMNEPVYVVPDIFTLNKLSLVVQFYHFV